jgi:hypothetical protein
MVVQPDRMRFVRVASVTSSIGLRLVLTLVMGMGVAQAQVAAGCTVANRVTTCNWESFRNKMAASHTVRAEYSQMDRSTGSQLKELAKELGKTVANGDDAADLTFAVVPASISGMDIGPADEKILELRIYSGGGSGRGNLVWVETYRGQKDRSWPANVYAAIQQFRERLVKQ